MPATTFAWYPDMDSQTECEPDVQVTKFGDGYEARVPIGINNKPQKWSLTFDRDRTTALAILTFLRARGGSEAFNWTTPLNETGVYVCRKWRHKQKPEGIMVSCDFEQVFEA